MQLWKLAVRYVNYSWHWHLKVNKNCDVLWIIKNSENRNPSYAYATANFFLPAVHMDWTKVILINWPIGRSSRVIHMRFKGKAVPLQAWTSPECSMNLRFSDFLTTAQYVGRPPLPPGNTTGTHFCQRLSRPQGHSANGRILYECKIHWHHLGSNQGLSDL